VKKIEQVNLDQAIINTVLALQDHSDNGVPFNLIKKGVADLMGASAPPPEKIFDKVEHLLGYDGMLHKKGSGGYYAVDLEAFASEVGIPDFNAKVWCSFEDEDMDEYVTSGVRHNGQVEDISDVFVDDDFEEEMEAVV
jgi:hypothetical protein